MRVPHSHQTKLAFPTEVLLWKVFIMSTSRNGQSHQGCFPQLATEELATITAYLHNHIYTIKLILSVPNKTLLKINQTTGKGLLSAGSNQAPAFLAPASASTHCNKPSRYLPG